MENVEDLASELIRTLRGGRSQSWLSRRAGYRSNIVHRWESGACWPTAARFLAVCRLLRVDLDAGVRRFTGHAPGWTREHATDSTAGVAAFLQQLRGQTPIVVLAQASGFNRYTISRWLKGTAEPKLPEFLTMIEVSSGRLLDFVETLVDPMQLPSVVGPWQQLQASREAAYGEPWSHAVLRALELQGRGDETVGQTQSLSTQLGIDAATVARALETLRVTKQIRRRAGSWVPAKVQRVDTRRDPVRAKALQSTWTGVAYDRQRAGVPGSYGYMLFAVSRDDLLRLQRVHLEYVRAMQSIIDQSEPTECVGLYCAQLLDLNASGDNALAEVAPQEQ